MGRMDNKVAVITGGSRGMGEATARLFVSEGAKVIIADVLEDEGRALAAEIGADATFIRLDVSCEEDWIALVASVLSSHGRIDALVNNAGVVAFGLITDLTVEQIDRVLGINLKGVMLGLKHVGGVMCDVGHGAIVNTSSVDGLRGHNNVGLYSSSKWGVRGLTKTAALEFGLKGVRVNSVHPGGVNTPLANPTRAQGEALKIGQERVPLQRIGEPNEVALANLFLCSDESSYICGAELAVDGGLTAGYYNRWGAGSPESLGA